MVYSKKGQLNPLVIFVFIMLVVIIGATFLAIGAGALTWTSAAINNITSNLGVVGGTNLSHASDVSIGTLNTSIQSLQWATGLLLVFALLGILIFAISIKMNPNGFLIGLYLVMVILMVVSAIYMSNIYEGFLNGTDEIATELQNMQLTSFIIIYLPHIITALAFIGGIIIFSGIGEEFQ